MAELKHKDELVVCGRSGQIEVAETGRNEVADSEKAPHMASAEQPPQNKSHTSRLDSTNFHTNLPYREIENTHENLTEIYWPQISVL